MTLVGFLQRLMTNPKPLNPMQEFVDRIPVPATVTTFDAEEPIILAANKLHERLTGYKSADLVGKSPRIFKGATTDLEVSRTIKEELRNYHFCSLPITNYKADGTTYNFILSVCGVIIEGNAFYCALKRTA